MKLTVPTNWEHDLIPRIRGFNVETIFGKLDRDPAGGGRASCVSIQVGRGKAREHVRQIHESGIKFFYLINSSCMGNAEYTRKGQKDLTKLLDWVAGLGADGVVVANPYLAQHVRRNYPHFKIAVSCFANVNSVERAKFWEDQGAYSITLSQVEATRDFVLLREIRKQTRCKLQLLANDFCIMDCPLFSYHNNVVSHASQTGGRHFVLDYCRLTCRSSMLRDPTNFIRASWIRPEDLGVYEDAGIDSIKLVDRGMHTDAIALIVKAYSERSYKGNLNDLFGSPSKSWWIKRSGLIHKLKYFFHPRTVNVLKLFKHRGAITDAAVYIDNTKLDGFIDHFFDSSCRYKSCSECGYCREIADKAVRIDPEDRKRVMQAREGLMNDVISGDLFK